MKPKDRIRLSDPQISIHADGDSVVIVLTDSQARIDFATIELTPEAFTAALGRLSNVECSSLELSGLDLVGLVHENQWFEFELPAHADYSNEKKLALAMVDEVCPEGWKADHYFDSQGSFFRKGEKRFARCTIRRWVKPS